MIVLGSMLQAASACSDDSAIVSPNSGEPRKATLTIVSGDHQRAEVSTRLPQPLVVVLRDSIGAPIPLVFVRFMDELGTVGDSVLTDASGSASGRWTLGTKAKTQRISAIATIYSGTAYAVVDAAFTATAVSGPATRVRISTTVEFASPRTSFDTVTAIVTDRFENGVAGAPIAWLVELGGGSVRALASATDTLGVARAIWTLGAVDGENILVATSGSLASRATIVASTGFPAVSLAVGGEHTCALTQSGTAYCWGSNDWGQQGTGTTDAQPRTSPSRVAGTLSFTQLVAGTFHTCGIASDGVAYCWGGNFLGQLGSARDIAVTPMPVATAQTFTALAAGAHHTCGLTSEKIILCWGDNTAGQLGDGIDRSAAVGWGALRRPEPAPVAGGLRFVALASTFTNTCAITTAGQTYCWGGNQVRELGTVAGNCRMLADQYYTWADWNWPCSTRPVPIDSQESLTSLTASGLGVCGVTIVGGLMCWGAGDLPPTVIPGARVSAAWSLGNIVCGVVEGIEAVSCWGIWDKTGRTPPPFGDGVALASLSSMGSTSCGVSRTQPSIAYCWGHNYKGQLGDGTTVYRTSAVPVGLPRTWSRTGSKLDRSPK